MEVLVICNDEPTYNEIASFLSLHNIHAVCSSHEHTKTESLHTDVEALLRQARGLAEQAGANHILFRRSLGRISELWVDDARTQTRLQSDSPRHEMNVLSQYILRHHSTDSTGLSCRSDVEILKDFTNGGNVCLATTPKSWIDGNPFFKHLPRSFYNRLVNLVVNERGMFPKVWSLRCQKNYWNSPLNGGLPITRKRDAVHEGTFMLHDLFHFLFQDPIMTGRESEVEAACYILYRMMSEACTLVLADMLGIAHADLKSTGYDVTARRIFPLFESLGLDPTDPSTAGSLMLANTRYCIFGDDVGYRQLGADPVALESFKQKYGAYFASDFLWNAENMKNVLSSHRIAPQLDGHIAILPESVRLPDTASLARNVVLPNGKISFQRMFGLFWSRVQAMINYSEPVSGLLYAKTAMTKYLSGQVRIAFHHPGGSNSTDVLKSFSDAIRTIAHSMDRHEILAAGQCALEHINSYIDDLARANTILPHERIAYLLHFPQFRPSYVNYDKDPELHTRLADIGDQILGKHLLHDADAVSLGPRLAGTELHNTYRNLLLE